jgi:hypothetical protein
MTDKNQTSGRDSWLVDNSITVTLPTGLSSKEIAVKLAQTREHLEELKKSYRGTRKGSEKEAAIFHEIIRAAKVIEMFKDRLIVDGIRFIIDEKDIEHPEAARKRLWWSWW